MNPNSPSPSSASAQLRRILGAGLLALATILPAAADKIATRNGQTLEGVISDQNDFYVTIEVRGIAIEVARDRILSIERQSSDDNCRMLLDRAAEALTRNEVAAARSFVEQVRLLAPTDRTIVLNLRKMDKEVSDLEQNGGSPDERHRRAVTFLSRANDAFDRVRIAEADELLIQSLKADPEYTAATNLIDKRLGRRGGADPILAARYFAEVLYPDHIPAASPVFAMLPSVYSEIVKRLKETTEIQAVEGYISWIRIIDDALLAHPQWYAAATTEQRALIESSVDDVLVDAAEASLKREDYPITLEELKIWADPKNTADEAILYTRAYVGSGEFAEAEKTLNDAKELFPNVATLRTQANALTLIQKGIEALSSGNEELASQNLEQVFNSQVGLPSEYNTAVGQRLSQIVAPKLKEKPPADQPWRLADNAALVMRYSQDKNRAKEAAQTLSQTLYTIPWNIDLTLRLNGVEVPLSDSQKETAAAALSAPLSIRQNPNSTFRVKLAINMKMPQGDADRLAGVIGSESSARIDPPVDISDIDFELSAVQPSLGSMFDQTWAVDKIPSAVAERRRRAQTNFVSNRLTTASLQSALTTGTLTGAAATTGTMTGAMTTSGTMPMTSPGMTTGTMPMASPGATTGTMPMATPSSTTGTMPVAQTTPVPEAVPATSVEIPTAPTSGTMLAATPAAGALPGGEPAPTAMSLTLDGSTTGAAMMAAPMMSNAGGTSGTLSSAPEAGPAGLAAAMEGMTSGTLGLAFGRRAQAPTGPIAQPTEGPVALRVGSALDFNDFIKSDLADFMSPNVTLLTQRLRIPMMQTLLTKDVILR